VVTVDTAVMQALVLVVTVVTAVLALAEVPLEVLQVAAVQQEMLAR